jgi:hypothetical protein
VKTKHATVKLGETAADKSGGRDSIIDVTVVSKTDRPVVGVRRA